MMEISRRQFTLQALALGVTAFQRTQGQRQKIRVLIVEDSAVVAEHLRRIISADPRFQVAGVAEMAMPVAAMRVRRSGASTEYVVRDGAEEFVDALERGGATVIQSSPMNLSEIFLECLGSDGKEKE